MTNTVENDKSLSRSASDVDAAALGSEKAQPGSPRTTNITSST
jgi:hypothetical protein